MANSTPVQPQGNAPSAPSPKKTSPWVWILGGCAAIVVIGGIVTSVLLWWGYHKAKNYVSKEIGDLGNMKTVSELWSDVPKMDGMTPTQNDMPMPVKLLARAILGNLGRLNKPGEDRTTGDVDWIVFSGSRPPDDLKTFYTPDRMASNGWDRKDQSCLSGSEQGFPQVGAFCVFHKKEEGGKETELAIIAWQETGATETNVFFLRLTPNPESR